MALTSFVLDRQSPGPPFICITVSPSSPSYDIIAYCGCLRRRDSGVWHHASSFPHLHILFKWPCCFTCCLLLLECQHCQSHNSPQLPAVLPPGSSNEQHVSVIGQTPPVKLSDMKKSFDHIWGKTKTILVFFWVVLFRGLHEKVSVSKSIRWSINVVPFFQWSLYVI